VCGCMTGGGWYRFPQAGSFPRRLCVSWGAKALLMSPRSRLQSTPFGSADTASSPTAEEGRQEGRAGEDRGATAVADACAHRELQAGAQLAVGEVYHDHVAVEVEAGRRAATEEEAALAARAADVIRKAAAEAEAVGKAAVEAEANRRAVSCGKWVGARRVE
jgi:hypothetical protein